MGKIEARDTPSRQAQSRRFTFDQIEIFLLSDDPLYGGSEQNSIRLDAWAPYGAPFGAVEHPVMDGPGVRCPPDHTIEGINLAHQMALAKPANSGIAAHRPDSTQVKAHQSGTRTHASGCARRFDTSVTAADNKDIIAVHDGASDSGRIACRQRRLLFQAQKQCFT